MCITCLLLILGLEKKVMNRAKSATGGVYVYCFTTYTLAPKAHTFNLFSRATCPFFLSRILACRSLLGRSCSFNQGSLDFSFLLTLFHDHESFEQKVGDGQYQSYVNHENVIDSKKVRIWQRNHAISTQKNLYSSKNEGAFKGLTH